MSIVIALRFGGIAALGVERPSGCPVDGSSLITIWSGSGGARPLGEEPEPRRPAEDQARLGLGRGEALAGADEERHAGPAPVLDVQAQRGVGLRLRVRRDAVDRAVALVLTAHVVGRIGGAGGAQDGRDRVLERARVGPRRRLHRDRRDHLHQVVDDDVAQRADRVVEVPAGVDAEVLGHRDLHARHVVAVPDRLEDRVREPQVEDLRQPHLPEEVVDPVQLLLAQVDLELGLQRPRRLEVVPERLLDDDARVLGEPGAGQAADDHPEQRRRDLEVEDRVLFALERGRDALEGGGVGEVAGQVGEPRREARERLLVDRLAAGLDRRARVGAQVVIAPRVGRDAEDRALQQPPALEPVQRPERHHPRQVAADAEDDEDVCGVLAARVGARARTDCRAHTGHRLACSRRRRHPDRMKAADHPFLVMRPTRGCGAMSDHVLQSSVTAAADDLRAAAFSRRHRMTSSPTRRTCATTGPTSRAALRRWAT